MKDDGLLGQQGVPVYGCGTGAGGLSASVIDDAVLAFAVFIQIAGGAGCVVTQLTLLVFLS